MQALAFLEGAVLALPVLVAVLLLGRRRVEVTPAPAPAVKRTKERNRR
jgi:hypothetical protein